MHDAVVDHGHLVGHNRHCGERTFDYAWRARQGAELLN